uniref:PB1 domain-containing protein n=1 Tax=Oryzias latipes TaxID=8090 RepID=A0A3P9MBK1_ORYLA
MPSTSSQQPMILCVVETDRARKLKLSSCPGSVDALIKMIKEQLEIDLDFTLQYDDPDFDGKLTSLADIEELPQIAVVHISLSQDSSPFASTALFSDVSSPERLCRWPSGTFPVPTFAFDDELKLKDGNAEYEKNNKSRELTSDIEHDILEKLPSTMDGFKAYPSGKEIAMAAEALVAKHPCLKEAGTDTGYSGWKNSLMFKMGNYRTKMRCAGYQEVTANSGKERAEVNSLPNFPQQQNPSKIQQLRQTIVQEVKKTERKLPLIRKMMEKTFPLRRQTIVMSCPPVIELLDLHSKKEFIEPFATTYLNVSFQHKKVNLLIWISIFSFQLSSFDRVSTIADQSIQLNKKAAIVTEGTKLLEVKHIPRSWALLMGITYAQKDL